MLVQTHWQGIKSDGTAAIGLNTAVLGTEQPVSSWHSFFNLSQNPVLQLVIKRCWEKPAGVEDQGCRAPGSH